MSKTQNDDSLSSTPLPQTELKLIGVSDESDFDKITLHCLNNLNRLNDEIAHIKKMIEDFEEKYSPNQIIDMKMLYDSYTTMVGGGSQIKLSEVQTQKISEYVSFTSNKNRLEALLEDKKDYQAISQKITNIFVTEHSKKGKDNKQNFER